MKLSFAPTEKLCQLSADGFDTISLWGDFDDDKVWEIERNLNKLNVTKWKDIYMQIIKIYELVYSCLQCWCNISRGIDTYDVIFYEFTHACKSFMIITLTSLLASFGLKFIIMHGSINNIITSTVLFKFRVINERTPLLH